MILNLGGGGTSLNFDVKAYATEEALLAATPKENTIGVITTTEITGWVFSATEPENPSEGMVWISTGSSSAVEFNALKKNGIQVYPLSAKQYVSGAWVDVTAMSYQGGEWVEWWNGEVYEEGVQHLPLTYYLRGAPEPVFEESFISLKWTNSSSGAVLVHTVDKYDVAKFNTLTLRYSYLKNHAYQTSYVQVGLISDIDVNKNGSLVNPVAVAGITLKDKTTVYTNDKFVADISSVEGQYYIAFSIGQDNSGNSITRSYDFRVTNLLLS